MIYLSPQTRRKLDDFGCYALIGLVIVAMGYLAYISVPQSIAAPIKQQTAFIEQSFENTSIVPDISMPDMQPLWDGFHHQYTAQTNKAAL